MYKNLKMVRPSDIMKVATVIDSCFVNNWFVWGDAPELRWATNNTKLIWAVIGSAMLMLVILLVPGLREIFSIPLLPTENILELIGLVLAPLVIVEIFKLFKINGKT